MDLQEWHLQQILSLGRASACLHHQQRDVRATEANETSERWGLTLLDLIPGKIQLPQVLGTGGPARGKGWAQSVADKKEVEPLSKLRTKDGYALLKKAEAQHKQPEDWHPFGALMKHLLESQVKENVIYPMEDSPIHDISGGDSKAGLPAPLPTIRTSPSMYHIPSSWRAV